jgi:hypothetical protein
VPLCGVPTATMNSAATRNIPICTPIITFMAASYSPLPFQERELGASRPPSKEAPCPYPCADPVPPPWICGPHKETRARVSGRRRGRGAPANTASSVATAITTAITASAFVNPLGFAIALLSNSPRVLRVQPYERRLY